MLLGRESLYLANVSLGLSSLDIGDLWLRFLATQTTDFVELPCGAVLNIETLLVSALFSRNAAMYPRFSLVATNVGKQANKMAPNSQAPGCSPLVVFC